MDSVKISLIVLALPSKDLHWQRDHYRSPRTFKTRWPSGFNCMGWYRQPRQAVGADSDAARIKAGNIDDDAVCERMKAGHSAR
jgi:hypothetical protein